MDIIFQGHETKEKMFGQLTDYVNSSPKPLLHQGAPMVLNWQGLDSCKVKILNHPGFAADYITSAWKTDVFKDHKAVIAFVEGFMFVFITTKDEVELPDIWNKTVEGSA